MKWLGIVLMVLTGIGVGLMGWLKLQRRVETLTRFSSLIERLADRIRYSATPIGDLLRQLLPDLFESLRDAEDPRERLRAAVEQRGAEWGLSVDDRHLLCGFADAIGRSDIEGEQHLCAEYRESVGIHLAQAREDLRVKGRLFVLCGVCGGLLIALLLW